MVARIPGTTAIVFVLTIVIRILRQLLG